ncbi:hypothetical protein D3C80_1377740 [compost metagenome]
MRSVVIYFIIILLSISYSYSECFNDNCSKKISSHRNIKDSCIENQSFKKKFFESLRYLEECVNGKKSDMKKFSKNADNLFIQSGIRCSIKTAYNTVYRKSDFYSDKKKWLDWYYKNKCTNLQWK